MNFIAAIWLVILAYVFFVAYLDTEDFNDSERTTSVLLTIICSAMAVGLIFS